MPFNATRFRAAALMGALVLAGDLTLMNGRALAQTTPAPGQAAPPGQQQQNTGPVRLELQPLQNEWSKFCGNAGANRQICFTTRDFGQAKDQPPLIALAVYDIKGEDPLVRFVLPPGLLLRPGMRFFADKSAPLEAQFTICYPNGCFAEAKIKAATIEAFRKGTTLSVVARNANNAELTFAVPIAGFGKSFDGPAMDPAVVQQREQAQQQELQRQLQDRAKQQRQQLEGTGAGAAAPAPAAPATTAPKP